jgi:hypothetical protein
VRLLIDRKFVLKVHFQRRISYLSKACRLRWRETKFSLTATTFNKCCKEDTKYPSKKFWLHLFQKVENEKNEKNENNPCACSVRADLVRGV